MAGCEEVEAYLRHLADAGFEQVRCLGPTDFYTSPATRGFDFVALKPAAPPTRWLRVAGAAALAAAVVAVAMHRARASA